jgi:LuxR family maltose regulon positive regulatory protein
VPAEPLLVTKLYVPRPGHNMVSRPRLLSRLNECLRRELTLVSAPAGFGKTTLLSEWVRHALPVAWVSLDEGDNDPVRFWSYVVAALDNLLAGIGTTVMPQLHTAIPAPIESFLTDLINELAAAPHEFALALDDYHAIHAEPIHYGLTYLLDHLPPPMHLFIATRADPPLPLARYRARGQMVELRAGDLRFTLDEAAAFLNDVIGLDLTARDVAALEDHTEGWVAGLQMAALSMRGRDDLSGFVSAFAGSQRYVLDYLVEEVLQRQPQSIQVFLSCTSILERMSGPLCDAVMGGIADRAAAGVPTGETRAPGTGSQAVLEYLEASNLFVVPLDDERRWYRYHRLFAECLRSRLEGAVANRPDGAPDDVRELHRRAAGWYSAERLFAEAVPHALAAQDWEWAAGLVERTAQEITLVRGEMVTLQNWLKALPDEVLRTRPRLCLAQAWVFAIHQQMEAAEASLCRAEQASISGEAEDIRAEITALRSLGAVLKGDLHRAAELARQALEQLPRDDLFLRSLVALDNGILHHMGGDVVAGSLACANAVRMGQQAGNIIATTLAVWLMGEMERLQGKLHRAVEIYRDAIARWGEAPTPFAGVVYSNLGEVLREWNLLDEAARYLTQGTELAAQWNPALALDGYVSLARVRQAQGDTQGAFEAMRRTEGLGAASDILSLDETMVATQVVRLWIVQGDLEAADRWAQACGLSADGEWSAGPYPFVARESIVLGLVRVLMAQGDALRALRLLDSLLLEAEQLKRTTVVIEVLTLQALARQALGETDAALRHLERALSLAEPEGFVRLFLDEGPPVVELLRQIAGRSSPEGIYARRLLAAFAGAPDVVVQSAHAPAHPPQVEPLSEREEEVLRLIADGLSNREIAERLIVGVGTVKTHINNIYGKLGVHSRTQALARARELGLV